MLAVGREHTRCIDTHFQQGGGDAHEWLAVLAIRWRVHDDPAASSIPNPEITPETRIAGRQRQLAAGKLIELPQPGLEQLNSGVPAKVRIDDFPAPALLKGLLNCAKVANRFNC